MSNEFSFQCVVVDRVFDRCQTLFGIDPSLSMIECLEQIRF